MNGKATGFASFMDLQRFMTVKDSDHVGFLQKYFPIIEGLQSGPAAVEACAFHAAAKAYRRNDGRLVHLELRLDPLKRTNHNHYSAASVVRSARRGLSVAAECYGMSTRLILCMDRSYSEEEMFRVIDLARAGDGIDVCGIEQGWENEERWLVDHMLKPMTIAKSRGIFCTYHVGERVTSEEAPAKSVLNVLRVLDINRIGHGVAALRCLFSMNERELNLMRQATFEICPTVNLVTHVLTEGDLGEAVLNALGYGVRIVACTDNPYLVNTTLANEHAILARLAGDDAVALATHMSASSYYLINN